MSDVRAKLAFDPSGMFTEPLNWEAESRVWTPNSDEKINYASDRLARGPLLDIVNSAADLSSMSPELEAAGSTWPASYYLSARRSSLLRPFHWNGLANVLEVGSGCGSVTRFLGETFASVVAIEGELHRAAVGASRSRDQENVAVVCAPYDSLKPRTPFDVLFCIGVLEYSPLFNDAADPLLDTLAGFRSRLTDDGALVLAIENKLGLKYFAGAAEDHTAIRFDGIEGYRRSGGRGPRTLGRAELKNRLHRAGFEDVEFFYPFPDYKLTRAIVSETAAQLGGSQLAEFIAHDLAGDYLSQPGKLHFNQRAVWHELCENGLVGDLANSFLVIASPGAGQRHISAPWDVASYNLTPRRTLYWNESRISGMAAGRPELERRRLAADSLDSASLQMPASYREPWYAAKTLAEIAADRAMSRSSTLVDVCDGLAPWMAYLKSSADPEGNLSGAFLDAIPQNLITDGQDLHRIDREWEWHEPLPLSLIVSRGLSVFYAKLRDTVGVKGQYQRLPIGRLMIASARQLGLEYSFKDLRSYCEFESQLRMEIEGVAVTPRRGLIALLMPPQAHHVKQSSVRLRRVAGKLRRVATDVLPSRRGRRQGRAR